MKLGLIELVTDWSGIDEGHRFDAARAAVQRDKDRVVKVGAALDEAKKAGCKLIVFPGWTLIGDSLPAEIVDASQGCTVILELTAPEAEGKRDKGGESAPKSKGGKSASKSKGGKSASKPKGGEGQASGDGSAAGTYILHDGAKAGLFVQRVFIGADVERGRRITEKARVLVNELDRDRGERHWQQHPDLSRITLLLCGEINLVGGGGAGGVESCRNRQAVLDAGLPKDWHEQTRLFINPAHVPGMPQAVRDKRAWLSGSGAVVVSTANLFQGSDWFRNSYTAAEAYRNKAPDSLPEKLRSSSYNIRIVSMNS